MKNNKPDLPPYTVKELRKILKDEKPGRIKGVFSTSVKWYFENRHKITVGEDAAFYEVLGRMERFIELFNKELKHG